MTKQSKFSNYSVETTGKIISIAGVILFGISLIGYLHQKEQLTRINQEKESFRANIQQKIDDYRTRIYHLNNTQHLCNFGWYEAFRRTNPNLPKCDSVTTQKREEMMSSIEEKIQKTMNEGDEGLKYYDQNISQEYYVMKTFYYSSIITGLLTFSGILMMFGQRIFNIMSGERIINTDGGEYRETNLHDNSRSIETRDNSTYYENYNQSQQTLAKAAAEIQKLTLLMNLTKESYSRITYAK